MRHLKGLGVEFRRGLKVKALDIRRGRVDGARVRDRHGRDRTIEADWFVAAMPVERAQPLWSRDVLRHDPKLELTSELFTDWMVGIQFYLSRPVDLVRGHLSFVDAPWALTALTQAQFWEGRDFAADYGDGGAVDCLSVDISDWDTPGILYGKPAKQCRPKEVMREVLAQIQAHVNDGGTEVLPDDAIHSWFLDPGVEWRPAKKRNHNATPLLVNTVGSWEKRPTARSEIPNLFLAADYVQTDIDLATMEGANESATRGGQRDPRGVRVERSAGGEVQALRPARVRGAEAGRRPALRGRAAERARRMIGPCLQPPPPTSSPSPPASSSTGARTAC